MSGDAELLNFIYQNSQMGVDTIRQLIGVVEDKDLKEHLKTQFQGYEEFHQAAKELLNEHGYDEKGLGIMEKARTYFMINLQTMTDPSGPAISLRTWSSVFPQKEQRILVSFPFIAIVFFLSTYYN